MPLMADVAWDLETTGGMTGAGVAKTIAKWTKPPSSAKPEVKHVSFKHAKTSPVPSRSPSPSRLPPPNPDYECNYCGNPGHTKSKCALAKGGGTAGKQLQQQKSKAKQKPGPQKPPKGTPSPKTAAKSDVDKRKCFECGQQGHTQRNCPDNIQKHHLTINTGTPACQICHVNGHTVPDCPKRRVPVEESK